jgi:hypothetical protein
MMGKSKGRVLGVEAVECALKSASETWARKGKTYEVVVKHLLGVTPFIVGVKAEAAPPPWYIGAVVLLQVVVGGRDKRPRLRHFEQAI